LVLRAAGFCGGKCAASVSLPSEWLSGKNVLFPRRVWFFGIERGIIQASAVMGGWLSGEAGVFVPRRVLRD